MLVHKTKYTHTRRLKTDLFILLHAGPFEPAFGAGPEYRDPAVPSDFDENRFRGDDHLGDPDVMNGIPGDNIPGGTGIPGSAPGETYASADAARVGGGLYWHLLERCVLHIPIPDTV